MMLTSIDKQQMRHHFSEHAGEYDLYARVQKLVAGQLLDQALDREIVGPVLDVGTGTGEVARRFQDRVPGTQVVVSDIAHDMTRTARQNLAGALSADGDAQALPFRSGSFGMVLSSSVFQWVEDLTTAFAECRRVLKPGGQFSFAMFCDGTLQELKDSFRQALDACHSDWPFHFQEFPRVVDVESALDGAGFDSARCRVGIETEYHDSFRELMTGLKRIGAQNVDRSRPRGLFPRRVMLEMKRHYDGMYRDGEGLPASYAVIYGQAFNVE